MVTTKKFDLVIVGAGPIGLFATFYAKFRGLNVALVESLEVLGGQPQNLYPRKQILDIPGWTEIDGLELINKLKIQMQQLQPEVYLNTTVTDIKSTMEMVFVETDREIQFKADTVLIATGKGSFEPRRLSNELEKNFQNHGLYYFAQNLQQFKGKRVAIFGGGNSAIDLANQLSSIAKETFIIHRHNNFRAFKHNLLILEQSDVKKIIPYIICDINKTIDETFIIDLRLLHSKQIRRLEVDFIIVSYGFKVDNKMIEDWSIEPEFVHQKILVDKNMHTSVKRVFAIGDASEFEHKSELIVTGFGDASIAINTIIDEYIENKKNVFHSSSVKIKDGQIKVKK